MTEELQTEAREQRQIYDPIGETPTSYVREPNGAHPPLDYPGYKSTSLRHPKQPLVYLPQTITEITGPQLGPVLMGETDSDLTVQHAGEPIGERIIVSGRVFDTEGKPLRGTRTPRGATSTVGTAGRRHWTRISTGPGAASPTTRAATGSRRSDRGRTPGAITTTPGGRPTSTSRCSAGRSPSDW